MLLKKVKIMKYRNFNDVSINLEENKTSSIYSIASSNGGGKSTLLQFIFILLHCFHDNKRKIFLRNIFENNIYKSIKKNKPIVNLEIEIDSNEYAIEFIQALSHKNGVNYDLYLDLQDIKLKNLDNKDILKKYEYLLSISNEFNEEKRITSFLKKKILRLRGFTETDEEHFLYREATRNNEPILAKKLISMIISRYEIDIAEIQDIESTKYEIETKLELLSLYLEEEKLIYITHIDDDNVLLIRTDAPTDILKKISDSIYLTAPASQIFLFLSKEDRNSIFSEFPNDEPCFGSYYDKVKEAKNNLPGFFTYDFAPTELILQSFKKSSEEDLKIKRKTGNYGSKYDELTNELRDFLDGKEITENEDGNRVIFRIKDTNEELSPEDLSHGELKKLGIYIWLKYIVDENSIVLMDEVDIALHPKWQYKLVSDLTAWSEGSQFLLATHSPQILSSTHYKNIIKLNNGVVTRYNKPPLDRDINAIITQVMEAPDFPEDLLLLHKKYRKLIKEGKVETPAAKKLKSEILEYESESSSFFQDVNFQLELM